MTDQPLPLKPCPFCGEQPNQPIKNLDIFNCSYCISWSESKKLIGVSGFTWSRAYCWKLLAEKEAEIEELKAALEKKFRVFHSDCVLIIEELKAEIQEQASRIEELEKEALLDIKEAKDQCETIKILTKALMWSHPEGTPAEHERLKALDRVRGK